MRPNSVIQAEWLYLLSILLLLVGAAVSWDALVSLGGVGVAAGSTAFFVGALALLMLFATRRGSRIARVLLAIVAGLSTLSVLLQVATGQVALGLVGAINIAQLLLLVVATVLLFRPNASAWFARPHADWEEDA